MPTEKNDETTRDYTLRQSAQSQYVPVTQQQTQPQPREQSPSFQSREVASDYQFKQTLIDFVKTRMDTKSKTSIASLLEEAMTAVIEAEIEELDLDARFESLFESIMAQVVQRQLMTALERRASSSIREMVRPGA